MELLFKKATKWKDLETSQIIHIAKNENTNGVTKHLFDKEISADRPAQQKSGVLPDNGRMTPQAVQRSSEFHSDPRPRVQGPGQSDFKGWGHPLIR